MADPNIGETPMLLSSAQQAEHLKNQMIALRGARRIVEALAVCRLRRTRRR